MEIKNTRFCFSKNSTIGNLTVDGVWIGFVLEPSDYGFTNDMTSAAILGIKNPRLAAKQYTAIPTGTYDIILAETPMIIKFKGLIGTNTTTLPLLKGVNSYEGVFIHIGNSEAPGHDDSEGCQVLGMTKGIDAVGSSTGAFLNFKGKCYDAIKNGTAKYTVERDTVAWDLFFGK